LIVTEPPPDQDPTVMARAVTRLLNEAGDGAEVTEVEITSTPTAGANRQTLMLTLHPGGQSAVAQIAWRQPEQTWIAPVVDEARLLRAAAAAGVPVPPVLAAGLSERLQADVLITGHVPGETIPRRVLRSLDELRRNGHDTEAGMAASCGRALAAIHRIDLDGLRLSQPLETLDRGRYVDHLRERLDDLPTPYPTFRFALNVLAGDVPAGNVLAGDVPAGNVLAGDVADGSTGPTNGSRSDLRVVHGDFRNGNLIVADGEIRAVLDWELAHLGDPMEDLAWLCLRTWRFGRDDNPAGGFASLASLRAAYEDHGGEWRQDAFDWWTIARTTWWGIGLAAQAARFIDGSSTSIVHAASGRRVVELEYDLLQLLGPLIR
jgi:aminoglycoside phosphotransferase (APT) family kinase protein